jgi:serine/threonine protein kinase
MWSVGCILYELLTGARLFEGRCALDQLLIIFQIRGTPTEGSWPGLATMPAFTREFPKWQGIDLQSRMINTRPDAVDLLDKML